MRIGELAQASGVPTSTIRYYERVGLLPSPPRTVSGYRTYDGTFLERLRFIRDGQATGLRLNEVAHLVRLREKGLSTCEHSLALLQSRVVEIDKQVRSLQRVRAQLERTIRRAADLNPERCTDPVSCQVISTAVTGDGHDLRRTPS